MRHVRARRDVFALDATGERPQTDDETR